MSSSRISSLNQTFALGEVPGNTTCKAIDFSFALYQVEFETPDGIDFTSHADGHYDVNLSTNGTKTTFDGSRLDPGWVDMNLSSFGKTPVGNINPLMSIFYGGDQYKFNDGVCDAGTIIPGFPMNEYDISGSNFAGDGAAGATNIIVPFTPITVPSGASSVTFEISWDLDNIIARYAGGGPGQEIFVLKNGWWNGLHITASVQ